jgi:hypothetical protein
MRLLCFLVVSGVSVEELDARIKSKTPMMGRTFAEGFLYLHSSHSREIQEIKTSDRRAFP